MQRNDRSHATEVWKVILIALVALLAWRPSIAAPDDAAAKPAGGAQRVELAEQPRRLIVPVEPEPLDGEYVKLVNSARTKASELTLADFPNQTLNVTISTTSDDGKVSYLVAGAAVARKSYEVILDYMKYKSLIFAGDEVYRVGIGLRVRAQVYVKKGNVNLSGLGALGAAASRQAIQRSLSVDVIGIDSKDVTIALPIPSQLSEESITSAIQAMATIKAKIYDPPSGGAGQGGTVITPQIIAKSVLIAGVQQGRALVGASK